MTDTGASSPIASQSAAENPKPYPAVLARVLAPHEDLGPDDRYHEWIPAGRVKADRLGRSNPRMYSATWTKWVCNNPSCAAFAFVSDDGVRLLIEEAE